MRSQAAARMISCLESIDLENPSVDRVRIERAVTDHLTALELETPKFVWCTHPRVAGWARMGKGHGRVSFYYGHDHRWIARLGLRGTHSSWSQPSPLSESDPSWDNPEPGSAGFMARLDDRIKRIGTTPNMRRSSTAVTTHVLRAVARLGEPFVSPPRGPRAAYWWYRGAPYMAVRSLEHLAEAAAAGLFAIWHCGDRCLLVQRPSLRLLDGELHCWDGRPAVTWSGGAGHYLWRGVLVPPRIGANPAWATADRIRSWRNAEVRRVAIERLGYAEFLEQSRATLVRTDKFGKLWRTGTRHWERLAFVEVVNSTPEPDGSYKTYFLSVPPGVQTPRAAIAWTFGYDRAGQYAPVVET